MSDSDSDSPGPAFSILKWTVLALAVGAAIWFRHGATKDLPGKEMA